MSILTSVQNIYNRKTGKINFELIDGYIEDMGKIYPHSGWIVDCVSVLVRRDAGERWDFVGLRGALPGRDGVVGYYEGLREFERVGRSGSGAGEVLRGLAVRSGGLGGLEEPSLLMLDGGGVRGARGVGEVSPGMGRSFKLRRGEVQVESQRPSFNQNRSRSRTPKNA
jgi:hypothetical protein